MASAAPAEVDAATALAAVQAAAADDSGELPRPRLSPVLQDREVRTAPNQPGVNGVA